MLQHRGIASRLVGSVPGILALLVLVISGCGERGGLGVAPTSTSAVGGGLHRSFSIHSPADVAEVMRIQDAHSPDLMSISDVIGTGTGATVDGRAAILVLTRRPDVGGIPSSLDGVPVVVRVVGDVRAYAKPGGGGPIECGTSTGNDQECASGTIGCVVVSGGSQYFLSNNHVFARENAASNGERIDAPGRYDAIPKCAQTPQLGILADFEPLHFAPDAVKNTIDAAIAAPNPDLPFVCAEAGGPSPTVSGFTPTANVVEATVGMKVKKSGRTSWVTHGTVEAINVTIQVGYSSGTATFEHQILTEGRFLRAGDSGSLMVTESGNDPVGLCFAGGPGGSLANPIGPVLQRFSATVCGQ